MEYAACAWRAGRGVCRCCLSEGCYKDIATEYYWMGERELYQDMLRECFDLTISYQDGGTNSNSRLICEVCITRLRDASNFKKQVINAEKRFAEHILTGSKLSDITEAAPAATFQEVKLEGVKDETGISDDDDMGADEAATDDPDYDPDYDESDMLPLKFEVQKKEALVEFSFGDEMPTLNTNETTIRRVSKSKGKSPSKKIKMSKKELTIKPIKASGSKVAKVPKAPKPAKVPVKKEPQHLEPENLQQEEPPQDLSTSCQVEVEVEAKLLASSSNDVGFSLPDENGALWLIKNLQDQRQDQESHLTVEQLILAKEIENAFLWKSKTTDTNPSSNKSCENSIAYPDYTLPYCPGIVSTDEQTPPLQPTSSSPLKLPVQPPPWVLSQLMPSIPLSSSSAQPSPLPQNFANNIPQEDKTPKRHKRKNEESWKRNAQKKKRNSGQEYFDYKGTLREKREPKNIGVPCSCKIKCHELINEEAKQQIFNVFWNLKDLGKQRNFLANNVEEIDSKKPRVKESRRKYTLIYNFTHENVKRQVCKKFFLDTLNVTDKMVRTALTKRRSGIGDKLSPDKRGRHPPGIKLSEQSLNHAISHIDSFPAVPSHWYREDPKKIYLEPTLNKEKMYELYLQLCTKDNVKPISKTSYRELLIKKNIGFYTPRKDST